MNKYGPSLLHAAKLARDYFGKIKNPNDEKMGIYAALCGAICIYESEEKNS